MAEETARHECSAPIETAVGVTDDQGKVTIYPEWRCTKPATVQLNRLWWCAEHAEWARTFGDDPAFVKEMKEQMAPRKRASYKRRRVAIVRAQAEVVECVARRGPTMNGKRVTAALDRLRTLGWKPKEVAKLRKGGQQGYRTAHASVAKTAAANEATSKPNAKPSKPPGKSVKRSKR